MLGQILVVEVEGWIGFGGEQGILAPFKLKRSGVERVGQLHVFVGIVGGITVPIGRVQAGTLEGIVGGPIGGIKGGIEDLHFQCWAALRNDNFIVIAWLITDAGKSCWLYIRIGFRSTRPLLMVRTADGGCPAIEGVASAVWILLGISWAFLLRGSIGIAIFFEFQGTTERSPEIL